MPRSWIGSRCKCISLPFTSVLRFAQLNGFAGAESGGTLLHHVSKLMHQQLSPFRSMRCIPSFPKHHILRYGVRQSVLRPCRFRRSRIGMYTHPAEVMTEARFHEGTGCRVEGLSG